MPGAQFAFVGGDTPVDVTGGATVGRAMRARLPRRVRRQVRFHGTQDRAGVLEVLSAACAAVVPSRWENFPYSCIESMSSGLPVIASPHGGMREMIVDGASGWLAPDGTAAGLAHALTRALAASGAARQDMGAAAAAAIRRVCDNDTIVARHLDLKTRLVRAGARRARTAGAAPAGRVVQAQPLQPGGDGAFKRHGLGLVIAWDGATTTSIARCLTGIQAQTAPPVAVRLVCDGPPPGMPARRGCLTGRWFGEAASRSRRPSSRRPAT